jgi:flagellar hook-associated protein 1 FlgK
MSGLFGSLEIGRKSLMVQQQALQVTSNNIANVNTPGYSRQRAVLESSRPLQAGLLQIGTGVEIKTVESARDRFLEIRVAQGNQGSGKQQALVDSSSQIEAVFNVGDKGLQEAISRFFNSFSTLANDPTSSSLRSSVVSTAENLSNVFQSSAQQLVDIQQNTNGSIIDTVSQINHLASAIASLNHEIGAAEAVGGEAATLRDQRTELVNQLSNLVDIHYYEDEGGNFSVSVAGGQSLVTADFVNPLTTSATPPSGLVQVKSGPNEITSLIQGGKLAGLIQVRDQLIPAYQNDLDTLAESIISQVNTVHTGGTDLQVPPSSPGLNFFDPVTGVAGAAQAFSLNPAIAADLKNIAAGQSGSPGDNANALTLANLANQKVLSGGTETFAESFASLQFRVGTDTQSAKRSLDTQSALLKQLKNQRDSVSAVSLDEEAIDLIRFQRAYQASAKFISTIDQLTADLIQNLPG